MIRVLLADDQSLFRQGLVSLLSVEADVEIVGQAANGFEAIALTERLRPDVILMDVQMPECDGVVATQEIHQRFPWIRILVLTTFDDDEYVWRSLQVGALGYLLKRTPSEQIAAAIRSVHLGCGHLDAAIATKVFTQLKQVPMPSNPEVLAKLTKRDIEVLKLLSQGKSNLEIAKILHLTEGTVKNYVSRIFGHLGVRDRIQAALWAQRHLQGGLQE